MLIGFAVEFLSFATTAQAAPLLISSVPHQNGGTLPYVQSGNADIDYRINNLIFLNLVGLPAPIKPEDGLPKSTNSRSSDGWFGDYAFEVVRNDGRVLSLEITYSGCGASCASTIESLNFDAATGHGFSTIDLFTPAGAAALIERDTTLRTIRLQSEIDHRHQEIIADPAQAKIAAELANVNTEGEEPISEGEIESYEAEMLPPLYLIHRYEHCIQSFAPRIANGEERIENAQMTITPDGVTFIHDQCDGSYYGRYLDEVGRQSTHYSFKDLAPYLNEYGRYMLLDEFKGTSPSSGAFGQVLHGHIGKMSITLKLNGRSYYNGTSIEGVYFYDRYRIPIWLTGKIEGDQLELKEVVPQAHVPHASTPRPSIRATIKDDALNGVWVGTKQLNFNAAF
jgi:hypothetical protein